MQRWEFFPSGIPATRVEAAYFRPFKAKTRKNQGRIVCGQGKTPRFLA
jgi:hypothetical protein